MVFFLLSFNYSIILGQAKYYYAEDKPKRKIYCLMDSLQTKMTFHELFPYSNELKNHELKSFKIYMQMKGRDVNYRDLKDSLPAHLLQAINLKSSSMHLLFENILAVNKETGKIDTIKTFWIRATSLKEEH